MKILIKRAYDTPAKSDGYRVLVDRLWPRGVAKEALQIGEWCKEIAPSSDLRKWFNHDPEKFKEFNDRYKAELDLSDEPRKLIDRLKGRETLTLVYSAKNPEMNQAVVLSEYLAKL